MVRIHYLGKPDAARDLYQTALHTFQDHLEPVANAQFVLDVGGVIADRVDTHGQLTGDLLEV
jgi:hypothetical protein